MTDVGLINDLLADAAYLDSLDIPEPDYEIEVFDSDEDDGCAGGACKI